MCFGFTVAYMPDCNWQGAVTSQSLAKMLVSEL